MMFVTINNVGRNWIHPYRTPPYATKWEKPMSHSNTGAHIIPRATVYESGIRHEWIVLFPATNELSIIIA